MMKYLILNIHLKNYIFFALYILGNFWGTCLVHVLTWTQEKND